MTLSLFGLNSFSFRDPARQIPWTVRLLAQGQPFGLNFALKHDSAMPVVEFYDARYAHTELGQFVTRYRLDTLLDAFARPGTFLLDAGIDDWQLSPDSVRQVHAWLTPFAHLVPNEQAMSSAQAPEISF